MITPNRTPWQPNDWQKLLQQAFRQPASLLAHLKIAQDAVVPDAEPVFAMLVPEPFFQRMQPGNPLDPLLQQVLPMQQEYQQQPGFVADPRGETDAALDFQPAPTLMQK